MVRIVASAELPTDRDQAWETILDPKNMSQWLTHANGLKADRDWPRFNSLVSWEIDGDLCEGRVVDHHLPDYLKVEVTTPSHTRTVTHRFTPVAEGKTLYERIVDAELKGFNRFLGSYGIRRLRQAIESEVTRAASFVSAKPAPTPAPKGKRKG